MNSPSRRPWLELRIPPLVVAAIAGAITGVACGLTPGLRWEYPGRGITAGVFIALGVAVAVLGVASFRRAGTTVNPLRPDSSAALVAGGIYQITRNPMYLGFLLVLAGWVAWLANPAGLAGCLVFVVWMNRYQIRAEETALLARFGDEYRRYQARVRRWL